MEVQSNNLVQKSHQQQEINIEASRKRYNNLIRAFKLFFISLTLITLALITYLIQSESLLDDSIHHNPTSIQIYNPTITTESEIFNLSLQNAAYELERATSLISKTKLALKNCRRRLPSGSLHLRETIRANPFPGDPSDRKRVEMENLIASAEEDLNACRDDLAALGSSAALDEVREAVVGAAAYLGERGDFLMSYRARMLRKLREAVMENLIVICLLAFQMFFVFFLFWNIFKSG